jgi:N-acetylmuramoyl-L-alanine amidase
MRKIKEILIHCSASSFGDASDIDQWHKERGWSGIGYHYVILNGFRDKGKDTPSDDGFIEAGRPIEKMGAHCSGHNRNTIGICLIGVDKFTDKQRESLKSLLNGLKVVFNLTNDDIKGHYEYSSKSCPNFNVEEYLQEFCS